MEIQIKVMLDFIRQFMPVAVCEMDDDDIKRMLCNLPLEQRQRLEHEYKVWQQAYKRTSRSNL